MMILNLMNEESFIQNQNPNQNQNQNPNQNQLKVYILIICLILFSLACITNPNDQRFHQYLNQISLSKSKSKLKSSSALKLKLKLNSTSFSQSTSSHAKHSLRLSTLNYYFKFNFLFGTLILIKNDQSSNITFKTFLGCFGSWFTLDLFHNLNQIKFNYQSLDFNQFIITLKFGWIRIRYSIENLLGWIYLKLILNEIDEQEVEVDQVSSVSTDSLSQESNSSQSLTADSVDVKDELQFDKNGNDDRKGELRSKQNLSNLEPIRTNDSQRIEVDDTKFPISPIQHDDELGSFIVQKVKTLSSKSTITREEVEIIETITSKLMNEDHQEVGKVEIVTIEDGLNEAHSIEFIPKSKKSKCKSKSENKELNERKALSESEVKLNSELNSIQFKKNEEDLKKLHFKSSLKHLNEIKDLKEFKRRNLNEKLNQFKLLHNNLIIKSKSYQNDIKALDLKEDCILISFKEDFKSIQNEEIKMKLDLNLIEDEIEFLNSKYEEKQEEVRNLKERLKEKKLKLKFNKKQETIQSNGLRPKDSSDLIECKPKVMKIFTNPNRPRSNTNSTINPTNPRTEEIEHHSKSNRSNHQFKSLSTSTSTSTSNKRTNPIQQESILRPTMEFIPIIQSIPNPTINHWEPIAFNHQSSQDPWTEEIQEHIKDNFSNLPNLERSSLSKHKSKSFSLNTTSSMMMKPSIDLKLGHNSNLISSTSTSTSLFGPIGSHSHSNSNSTASSPIIHHGLNPLPNQLLMFPTTSSTSLPLEFGTSSSKGLGLDFGNSEKIKPASRLERLKKVSLNQSKINEDQDHSIWMSNPIEKIQSLLPNLISSESLDKNKFRGNSIENQQENQLNQLNEIKIRKSEPITSSLLSSSSSTTETNTKRNSNPINGFENNTLLTGLSLNPFAKSFKFEGKKNSHLSKESLNNSKRKSGGLGLGLGLGLGSLDEVGWNDNELDEIDLKKENFDEIGIGIERIEKIENGTGIGIGNEIGTGIDTRIGIGKFGAIGSSKID